MEDKKLIPRRRVLGLGVALAGLCAGCAVLPAGSTESAAGSQAASGEKAADKVEKAPLEDINSVHLRDNSELYTVYDDSGVVTPPVGAVLFIGSAVAKRPMEKVVKATLPFYLCMFIALLLLTYVPDISLAIPKLLGGYVSPITNPLGPVFIH